MIALLILMLGSCKKNTTGTLSTKDTSGIVGNWKWIETYSDGAPSNSNPLTPKYTGYQKLLRFNPDNSFQLTKNNVIIDSGTYIHGHGVYTNLSNKTFIYDSIIYHHNSILNKDSVDYYIFYNDTLCFNPGLSGKIAGGGSDWWKKQ